MPLQLPGLAVRVWPLCGVPEIVGGWVLTGGETVGEPPWMSIVSTTVVNAWAAVSFPICTVDTPAVPRLALVVW